MRKLLIDTDTASDDAVALIMALRDPSVHVQAITTVAGNCEVNQCTINALVSIEYANTYAPPVYTGMKKPLLRPHFKSLHIHGDDGMGNMLLTPKKLKQEEGHAVDAIIDLANSLNGELEVVTLGPLTNLAMAVLKDPDLPNKIKHVYVMGGAGLSPGNITPLAEFNFYVDAEAADIVIQSGLILTIVGWEIGMGKAFINEKDIDKLNNLNSLGEFVVKCNKSLMEFNSKRTNRVGFDLPDPTTMSVALSPGIIEKSILAHSWVEYKSEKSYGHYVIDSSHLTKEKPNAVIVTAIKDCKFKELLFKLLR